MGFKVACLVPSRSLGQTKERGDPFEEPEEEAGLQYFFITWTTKTAGLTKWTKLLARIIDLVHPGPKQCIFICNHGNSFSNLSSEWIRAMTRETLGGKSEHFNSWLRIQFQVIITMTTTASVFSNSWDIKLRLQGRLLSKTNKNYCNNVTLASFSLHCK